MGFDWLGREHKERLRAMESKDRQLEAEQRAKIATQAQETERYKINKEKQLAQERLKDAKEEREAQVKIKFEAEETERYRINIEKQKIRQQAKMHQAENETRQNEINTQREVSLKKSANELEMYTTKLSAQKEVALQQLSHNLEIFNGKRETLLTLVQHYTQAYNEWVKSAVEEKEKVRLLFDNSSGGKKIQYYSELQEIEKRLKQIMNDYKEAQFRYTNLLQDINASTNPMGIENHNSQRLLNNNHDDTLLIQ